MDRWEKAIEEGTTEFPKFEARRQSFPPTTYSVISLIVILIQTSFAASSTMIRHPTKGFKAVPLFFDPTEEKDQTLLRLDDQLDRLGEETREEEEDFRPKAEGNHCQVLFAGIHLLHIVKIKSVMT